VVAAGALVGCRGEPSEDPPIYPIRNMFDQPRYNPQSYSAFFEDGRTMRTPVEGTQSREFFVENEEVETGRLADGSGWALTVPTDAARHFGGMPAMILRGQERYNIYCAPCHDQAGHGNGTVVQRGFQKPPSLHEARIRHMPDGQLYATIANGVRNMPAYGAQVHTYDRWAIVTYVRALELSQVSMMEPRKQ
jgi:hypothetical protein